MAMLPGFSVGYELIFLFNLLFSVVAGYLIGIERESRGKDAGISTNVMVIGGSMLFTFLSALVDPQSTSRISAQIITGIGFLGAGLILRESHGRIKNLTTAAGIWFAAAIGMAIGYGFYVVALTATIASIIIPRIPHIHKKSPESKNFRS
ncbi:MgtC/SapB family protein [Candidatus Woesearchaeota archaeon]|nr:MgtC/SapB family protein [Candidatus Woesearchaeota archaeon]